MLEQSQEWNDVPKFRIPCLEVPIPPSNLPTFNIFVILIFYSPTDLDPGYLPKYLDDAITHDKSTWRQHFYEFGTQHEDCPDVAWQTWHSH